MIIVNLLYVFIFLISNLKAQNEVVLTDLSLDVLQTGKIIANNNLYYKYTVPDDFPLDTFNLAIRVKESDAADLGQEDFSDPDVYVSKVNTF